METTREEHMAWCKKRALAYLPYNPREAAISMVSDLGKHEETKDARELAEAMLLAINLSDLQAVRDFIEGFN